MSIFFHPDYTVGFGISPNLPIRLVGFTTGGEFHPALKEYSVFIIIPYIEVNEKNSLKNNNIIFYIPINLISSS